MADKEILRGWSLTVVSGQTHAIMGPNGSGKSTLAYALAGHPAYRIRRRLGHHGRRRRAGHECRRASPAGLFLAMRYPVEVPGVSVSNFLRTLGDRGRGEARRCAPGSRRCALRWRI